jgi:hypothetical protein
MTKNVVEVHPGVCGFMARIEAASEDQRNVAFHIESECENIRALEACLSTPVDSYVEIREGFAGKIHQAVQETLKGCCSGCVVPSSLFKAMQVVAGLALPLDAQIRFGTASRE